MAEVSSIAFQSGRDIPFDGAKVTVFVGSQIVTLLRDDIPQIPMPAHWDFPGGAREGDESPWACARRECQEETALELSTSDLLWGRCYRTADKPVWFFVARIDAARASDMRLGDEGQELALMSVDHYLQHPKAIPQLQQRLADWLAGRSAF